VTRLAVFIATAAYCGYFPVAPGTVGSAAGLVVYAIVWWTQSPIVEVALIASLFVAGVWAGTTAEQYFGGIDPGPVVIDEVVGMLITLAFIPVGWSAALAGFFRSCGAKNFASHSAAWIDTLADQTPSARSEVVTYDPLPVRSRR